MAASKLSQPPRVARALTGPGRLPLLKNLVDKSPEDLIRTLNRFGIDPDLKAIDLRARQSYGRFFEKIIEDGIEPDEAMWAKLESDMEAEMTRNLRKMAKRSIQLYRQDKLTKGGGPLVWICVAGGSTSCPSCEPRHGQVKTRTQWERIGMPGSGGLICNGECRCEVLPAP